MRFIVDRRDFFLNERLSRIDFFHADLKLLRTITGRSITIWQAFVKSNSIYVIKTCLCKLFVGQNINNKISSN